MSSAWPGHVHANRFVADHVRRNIAGCPDKVCAGALPVLHALGPEDEDALFDIGEADFALLLRSGTGNYNVVSRDLSASCLWLTV